MPDYVFAYHGGETPTTQEEGEKAMAAWTAWFDGMGDAVVNPGNPVGLSKTVTAQGVEDDGGANPLTGFSVVAADTIEAAVEMAKGCPIVTDGSGSVEVAEIHEI
ncbi:YciI family protein [Roseobacter sinensis]|uniref:YciI family protein n=1 Tax=Roseobacter sinensis TaxID=2931391 RepID=A0ABT3B8P9_9RHOB|nr:YciI family protein [Roseobacter sp. WL0113]MCV3269946.1 YciI family protein [Roseobacter sp. WL0113]